MNADDEIRLISNRVIALRELHQWRVYEGLLEGAPHTEMNAQIVSSIVARQIETALGGAVHLIQPVETPLPDSHPWRDVTLARLPPIACVGRFVSLKPARLNMCASELTIIWFQGSFSPAIVPSVLEEIEKTPWEALAHDFDF